jgi:hypothetical protein
MSLYKRFKTDPKIEKEGVLLDFGKNSKGAQIYIRVARAGGANQAYLNRMEARAKPHRRSIQNDTIERVTLEKLILDVYAETVVLGWENVEDENGNELPFNKDNVIKLFTDLPDVYEEVKDQAQKGALYRQELLEADAKN